MDRFWNIWKLTGSLMQWKRTLENTIRVWLLMDINLSAQARTGREMLKFLGSK